MLVAMPRAASPLAVGLLCALSCAKTADQQAAAPGMIAIAAPGAAPSKEPDKPNDLVFRSIDLHGAAAFLAEVFQRTVVVTAKSTRCHTFDASSDSEGGAFAALARATGTRVREAGGMWMVTDANAPSPAAIRAVPGPDVPFESQEWMDTGEAAFRGVTGRLGYELEGTERVPGRVSIFPHGTTARALLAVLFAESHTELAGDDHPRVASSSGFGWIGDDSLPELVSCSLPEVENATHQCTRLGELDVRAARIGGSQPIAMLYTRRLDAPAVHLNGKIVSAGMLIGLNLEHRIVSIGRRGVALAVEPQVKKPMDEADAIPLATDGSPACGLVPVKSAWPFAGDSSVKE